MPTMFLDHDTQVKLSGIKEMTEIRDKDGRLIGHFVPIEPACPWEPGLTEEEIRRRIDEPGGTTLSEFWRQRGD